jgi:hypothetical protein
MDWAAIASELEIDFHLTGAAPHCHCRQSPTSGLPRAIYEWKRQLNINEGMDGKLKKQIYSK